MKPDPLLKSGSGECHLNECKLCLTWLPLHQMPRKFTYNLERATQTANFFHLFYIDLLIFICSSVPSTEENAGYTHFPNLI
jgi:hypothetical protein